MLSRARPGAREIVAGAALGDAIAEVVAGAAFCASERGFAWQGQHLAAV